MAGYNHAMRGAAATGEGASPRPPLHLTNLLNDLGTLGPLAVQRAHAGDLLNTFLLLAGMEQATADHLDGDRLRLRRAAGRLERRSPAPWGGIAGAALRAGSSSAALLASAGPGERRARLWHRRLRAAVGAAADELVRTGAWERMAPAPALDAAVCALVAELGALPRPLRRAVLRLPTSFRNLDQAPADLAALSRRLHDLAPGDRPLVVAGVRASGSYLAPLHAAQLRALGRSRVSWVTLRPGIPIGAAERRELRSAARAGGLAAIVDDPPRSWSAAGQAAAAVRRCGFPPGSIALVLQVLPGAGTPPPSLSAHPALLLPWEDWEVRRRLEPEAVGDRLASLLGAAVTSVRALGPAHRPNGRGHASAAFEVLAGGVPHRVRVRGVGLGYFGEHAPAVASRLASWVPAVHGLEAGLLYEDGCALPLLSRPGPPELRAMARYVAARAAALPAAEDMGPRLAYRGAAWQWGGNAFASLFGRAREAGRPIASAVVREALDTPMPAVVDAHTEPAGFALDPAGRVLKRDYDAGAFTGIDLVSFDPVFDLARTAVTAGAGAAELLRREFEAAGGRPVEAGRWLLHQVIHAAELDGGELSQTGRGFEHLPRAFQRYYGEAIVGAGAPAAAGPVCALDVDGVLESMVLGFPATSPAGALALRALARHGFRTMLATGRSLTEARDRCLAYGLAGAVAEYGGVVLDASDGEVSSLVSEAERDALARLRRALAGAGGICLEPGRAHSVRAFRVEGDRRRPLEEAVTAGALEAAAGRLRAISGRLQTDFVPAASTKERGLTELLRLLGAPRGQVPLALAVGDSATDAGMLAMAAAAYAPAAADPALRAVGARVLGSRGPAAVAEAVACLLGHRPGGCPVCALPAGRPDPLAELLALQDRRGPGKALAISRLALRGLRAHRPAPSPAEARPRAM